MSEQNIVNISEANLQQTLQQSMNVPVLFYFWSARSQHCEQLTPVLERLAAQYNGQFTLAKVDCDAEQRHCCKVSDEAAFCLIQRPYISKTLLTRRISPRGSP